MLWLHQNVSNLINQSLKLQKYATSNYNLKLTPQLLITTLNVFAFLWCVAKWRMVVYLVSTPPGEKGILTWIPTVHNGLKNVKVACIRKSHWHHTMVDGAKFWIICKQLKLLRKAGCLQNSTPSTIVWHQCDIGIPIFWLLCFHKKMQSFLFHLAKAVLGSRADKAAKLL